MAKKPDRQALCRELLTIEKKRTADFTRYDAIKAELKTDASENFKIVVNGLGEVSVSAPKPKRCEGTAPELVVENFLKLPERERKTLIKLGLVIEAEQWKSAYYGSVTTKLF
jgi:hypothetical protein